LRQLRHHLRDPEKYARAGQNQGDPPNQLNVMLGLILLLHPNEPACASHQDLIVLMFYYTRPLGALSIA
jgi:hypothetical protein